MNNKLKEIVEDIYQSHSPLNKSETQLLYGSNENDFKKLVEKKIKTLNQREQTRIKNELFGFGPLTPLMENGDIFDILVQGSQFVFYENSKGMKKLEDCFLTDQSFKNFCERMMKKSQLLINKKDPFANGKIENFRIHMIMPPITSQITITLRKQGTRIRSLDELTTQSFISQAQKLWFVKLLEDQYNFLVIGPTGSGKTTFLNSLINELQENQRLVIIEDTDEIQVQNPLSSKLLSRELCPGSLSPVNMSDLVKQSLRMRPDRLVVGEVRGHEAKDLLQALATGHRGSMGTLHAQSAKQALLRLEMLIQMGAPQWNLHSIRQLIQMSLDYLIVLKDNRLQKGIKEICKITSHEKFGLLLQKVNTDSLISMNDQGFKKSPLLMI